MSLNIKNPEAHAMAARLARRLDSSMTRAVTVALEDKLAATEAEAMAQQRLERLLSVANAIAGRLTPEQRAMDPDAELYDASGLPQ
jgi:antitoxin VapB